MKVHYNPRLKELSRELRKISTKSEIKLWQYLKNKQLIGYDFHRQKPIDNFIVDFFCNKLSLAIELDGYTHTFEEVSDKDKSKEENLNRLGITLLRFCDEDIMKNTEGVLGEIRHFIESFEEKKKTHTP